MCVVRGFYFCCVVLCFLFFFFFFFQAEDGIRDIGVTGVQTCALPILCGGGFGWILSRRCLGFGSTLYAAPDAAGSHRGILWPLRNGGTLLGCDRSEERRVGKECRYGWVADREKNETTQYSNRIVG